MLTLGMTKCLLPDDELIRRYQSGEPLASLMESAGISRTGVWKRLKRLGVHSERRTPPSGVACHLCRKPFVRHRHHAMRSKRQFCSSACYLTWVSVRGASWRPYRHGQRIARRVVARYVTMPPGSVVHHHDGDNHNNAPENLALFASQSDHMKHHRGDGAPMLWDGRTAGV